MILAFFLLVAQTPTSKSEEEGDPWDFWDYEPPRPESADPEDEDSTPFFFSSLSESTRSCLKFALPGEVQLG